MHVGQQRGVMTAIMLEIQFSDDFTLEQNRLCVCHYRFHLSLKTWSHRLHINKSLFLRKNGQLWEHNYRFLRNATIVHQTKDWHVMHCVIKRLILVIQIRLSMNKVLIIQHRNQLNVLYLHRIHSWREIDLFWCFSRFFIISLIIATII